MSKVVFLLYMFLVFFPSTENIHDPKCRSTALEAPLKVVDIDDGSGLLIPIVDIDLNLLFIAGKVR